MVLCFTTGVELPMKAKITHLLALIRYIECIIYQVLGTLACAALYCAKLYYSCATC